jgi:hypothetical protein
MEQRGLVSRDPKGSANALAHGSRLTSYLS